MLPYGSGYGSIAYTKRYQSVSRTESENSLPHIFYSNLHSKNYSEAKDMAGFARQCNSDNHSMQYSCSQ